MSDASAHRKISPGQRRRTLIAFVVIAAFLGTINFIYFEFLQTYHFIIVDPGKVYRDGLRSLREFRNAVRKSKPKTIVALLAESETRQPEFVEGKEYAKQNGMEYVWIPIDEGHFPTSAQIKRFLSIARDPAKQPVLYHDDEGIRRAGIMMAAYQMSAMGYDKDKAKAAIHTFGHSDRTIDDIRRFIDVYDPVNGLPMDLNAEKYPNEATTKSATTPSSTPAGE